MEQEGDIVEYLILALILIATYNATAAALDVSLEEVAARNVEKLKKRYPEGFEAERSLHMEG